MTRTSGRQFRNFSYTYLAALTDATVRKDITQEENHLIKSFISEINANRKITEYRKYQIASALITLRNYFPNYTTCNMPDIYLAIENYRSDGNHKESTQRNRLATLKRFLLWIHENGYSPNLNGEKLKKIHIPQTKPSKNAEDILTADEVQSIINATTNPRDKALLELLYDSMGRVGEVATLKWNQIEFKDNYATVTLQSKTDYSRKVPIYTAHVALRQLMNYTSPEPHYYIFAARNSNGRSPIAYQGVRQMVQKAAERAGITKNVTPHLFRHTRITDLMRMGISEQSIKMMAWGTVSTDMLKVYAHLTPSDVENEMNQMYGISTSSKLQAVPDIATPVQCKKCGLINPKSHQFCGGCTAALTSDVQTKHEEILEALEQGEVYEEILQLLRSKVGR